MNYFPVLKNDFVRFIYWVWNIFVLVSRPESFLKNILCRSVLRCIFGKSVTVPC